MLEPPKTMEQRLTVSQNCGLTTTTSPRLRSRRQTGERLLTESVHATTGKMQLAYHQAFHNSTASKATAAFCQACVAGLTKLVLDCNWLAVAQACNLSEHDLLCALIVNSEVALELAPAS